MRRRGDDESRTETVYAELRTDLLEGRIKPGERLKLAILSDRFGLSMTVIREALTRLAGQGLVVLSPNRGFMVKPLSIEDLTDLTHARVRLESMTLRDSIERGDLDWETDLLSAQYALRRTPMSGDDPGAIETWRERHRAFHHALLGGCCSPRLLAIADTLRDNSDIYRAWSRTLTDEPTRDLVGEHIEIAELALARDADGAVAALVRHIAETTESLLRYARQLDHA